MPSFLLVLGLRLLAFAEGTRVSTAASSGNHSRLASSLSLLASEPDHGADGGHDHGEQQGHDPAAAGHGDHGHGKDEHGGSGHDPAAAGHGDHGHGKDEHGGSGHGDHVSGPGAHSVAVGLVSSAVVLPMVMHMALSNWLVAELTMKMLDTFVSIFLAVLWFNTFSTFMDVFEVRQAFAYAEFFLSALQVFVLYGISMAIAWIWRDKTLTMTTFCSIGAHFIAFAGIMAGQAGQRQVASSAPEGLDVAASFLFCGVIVGMLALVSFLAFSLWRKNVTHDALNHAIEHLELDILGLVLSFLITQAVRHSIMGRYPPTHGHGVKHEAWHCWFMFGWTVGLTGIAGFCVPKLGELASLGEWAARGVRVLKVVLIMLIAWGYLLWGQWAFYEGFKGDAMFGHMIFAVGSTMVCLMLLYGIALLQGKVSIKAARETNEITIMGISLTAAWSWEHCFNIAFDVIGQEYQVGFGGLIPKLVLALVIPAVMLPTYVTHIRTRILEIEHREHGHDHGHAESADHHGSGHAESVEEATAHT